MSQFASNTDLFIINTLQFESNAINIEQVPISIPDAKFGILNLKAVSSSPSQEDNDFVFMVDCSGSMSDKCSDGRDKMHHILHTLKNMILYFKENQAIKIHITIDAFDDSIHRILDRSHVTEDNYLSIIEKINKISPRNSTNIELALSSVRDTVEILRSEFPNNNIVNIFMTDGEVSAGSESHSVLSQIVDRNITNAFIGFGIQHDAALLNSLSNGANSGYYFIDKLENSGLVYGEILHGVVYKLLKNVQISIQNGLIYDYKNNIWVENISIGEIVSEANKIYHIASSNPDDCVVSLSANKLNSHETVEISISRTQEYADHTKYIYRQRTLQHLYIASEFVKRKQNICDNSLNREETLVKENLSSFIKEMKNYMKENNMDDDKFMKNLCDDIYICYRTFGTKFGVMYTSARQTSQGTQRCYTVSHTPEVTQDMYPLRPPKLTRQTNHFVPRTKGLPNQQTMLDDFDLLQGGDEAGCGVDDIQHDVSDFRDAPYLTPTSTQVMREISIGTNDEESQFTNL